jgi:hypothetical protein
MSYVASAGGLDFKALAEQYGKLTVREITSGTSGLALAQLVAARAAIQLATLVDARQFCRVELVPPGGGKTYHFQKVAVPDSFEGTLTEGSDFTAVDLTLGDITATLTVGVARTDVSDIAQRQAAVNLAEVIGIGHGNALNRFINSDIYSTVNGATTNIVKEILSANSKNYTFSDIFAARGLVERARGRPDSFVTYPYQVAKGSGSPADTGFYPFVQTNITSVQFTTALATYLQTGQISELFGLRLFIDKVYEPATASADAAVMASVLQGGEAEGWAQAEDIVSEIQRWAPQVGFRIVTHTTGKSGLIMDPFVTLIEHTNS